MNKCIILCMCCNEPHYIRERLIICETWGRHVLNGEYENLDLWFYTSGNTTSIDIDNHIIYVNTDDGLYNTWEKTRLTFEILNKYFDYDFIFRTNCSTVINCQLLSAFINALDKQSDNVWCWRVVCFDKSEFDFFCLPGLGLILSYKNINNILNTFYNIDKKILVYEDNKQKLLTNSNKYIDIVDDVVIGYILDIYWKHEPLKYIKVFPCAFYNCNNYIWNEQDLAYNELNFNYFSQYICVRTKYEIQIDINIKNKITEQNLYDVSSLYETKISDDIIQNTINDIYENCINIPGVYYFNG